MHGRVPKKGNLATLLRWGSFHSPRFERVHVGRNPAEAFRNFSCPFVERCLPLPCAALRAPMGRNAGEIPHLCFFARFTDAAAPFTHACSLCLTFRRVRSAQWTSSMRVMLSMTLLLLACVHRAAAVSLHAATTSCTCECSAQRRTLPSLIRDVKGAGPRLHLNFLLFALPSLTDLSSVLSISPCSLIINTNCLVWVGVDSAAPRAE